MIDPEAAWPLIRENAIKALKTNMIWHSLVHMNEYRLVNVFSDHIIIQRQGNHQDQTLTETTVIQAANDFNALNGFVQRGHLIDPTVAEETAFVLFHPNLSWDVNNENIIEINI